MDAKIGRRALRRLEAARHNGYLDAICAEPSEIVRAHGRWCWRLRIPFVWFERQSPRSRYGSLYLEMFSTVHTLTPAGQRALRELSDHATVSAGHGCWRGIPIPELDRMAREAYRKASQAGNYRPQTTDAGKPGTRTAVAAAA